MNYSPQFIWPVGQNTTHHFALFRRELSLDTVPSTLSFNLFADGRYRLWVNGKTVGYGPARFHPDRPEYDTYDVASYLAVGENTVLVEVGEWSESGYQIQPSQGGFVAWADNGDIDLSTPGDWYARISTARSDNAPIYSFAMPRTEILDLRMWDSEKSQTISSGAWSPAQPVSNPSWGKLVKRTVPMPTFETVDFIQAKMATLSNEEDQYRFHHCFGAGKKGSKKGLAAVCTLLSPKEQTIELAGFWGKDFINGKPIKRTRVADMGNREVASVTLNAGENVLYHEMQALGFSWGHQIGIPRDAGVTVTSLPGNDGHWMVSSEFDDPESLSNQGKVPESVADVLALGDYFSELEEGQGTEFPSREVAWSRPKGAFTETSLRDGVKVPLADTGKCVLLCDYGRTFTGHPYVTLTSEEDVIVDISYDERIRPDGLINMYNSNHLVNTTDRFRVGKGVNTIEVLPERGGRYVQFSIQSYGAVSVNVAGVRMSTCTPDMSPVFTDAPDFFHDVVRLSRDTLLAGYAECFTDSPWREQGMYLGDHYVQYLAMRALVADESVIHRCLQVYADCQHPNGQIPAVCPGHYKGQHEDFTLIWILILEESYRRSGNTDIIERLWPCLERIFNSEGFHRSGALVGGDKVFVDWGVKSITRAKGCVGADLSAFKTGALRAAITLANAIGKTNEARGFKTELDKLVYEFHEAFYDDTLGAYSGVPVGHEARLEYSCHTNVLALLYDLVPSAVKDDVLKGVIADIEHQIDNRREAKQGGGHLEFYFQFYAYRLLAREGHHELVERMIEAFYGLNLEAGDPNLWECYCRGYNGQGSLCHGWSSAAMVYYTEEVLGVTHPNPSDPNTLRIAPQCAGLDRCSGIYPHAKGPVNISWVKSGTSYTVTVDAPDGVNIELAQLA